jgi:nitrite reductase (NADH) large subunit
MNARLLIVGGGIAAFRLIFELLARGADGRAITLVCGEPHPPYDRVRLSEVVEGRAGEHDLQLAPEAWYRDQGITLHLGRRARAIDRAARTVEVEGGARLRYDRLVLATGSTPIRPAIVGIHHPQVLTLRDLADAGRLARAGKRVVVLGGGLLGIETAASLARLGRAVTLVHRGPWLLDRQIDREAGALVRDALEQRGLEVVADVEAVEIEGGRALRGLRLADGRSLEADLVVLATGARRECRLAREAGLECADGVVVGDGLQTSDGRIFALGECAQHPRAVHGFVEPIAEQAAVLARRLLGDLRARFSGTVPLATLKADGLALAFAGAAGGESLVLRDPGRGVYRRLFLEDGRLAGAVLIGDARDGAWLAGLIASGMPLGPARPELIFGRAVVEACHGADILDQSMPGERLAA